MLVLATLRYVVLGISKLSPKLSTYRWDTLYNYYCYLKDQAVHDYDDFAHEMVKKDPHAVFPTNIYRQCDGYTVSTKVKF